MIRVSSPAIAKTAGGIAALALLLGTAGAVSAFSTTTRDLSISVDGAVREARVDGTTVREALASAGVAYDDGDEVLPGLDEPVDDGQTITITHAQPAWILASPGADAERVDAAGASLEDQLLRVRQTYPGASLLASRTPDSARTLPLVDAPSQVRAAVDGQIRDILAAPGATAAAVLAKNGITLSPLDQVAVSLDGAGSPVLTVTRIARSGESEDQEIPYETEEVEDDTLFAGQRVVETAGVAGVKQVTYAVTSADGQESSRQPVSETVMREPVTEVVRVGTKKLESGASLSPSGTTAGDAQTIARTLLGEAGFGDDQFQCLVALWNHESGWNYASLNSSSGAYGIPQALPGSKMASAGADWKTNPATQIRWGLGYIKGRYGNPCGALSAWQSKGWY